MRRLLQRLAAEDGIALVMVLGLMLLLSVIGVTMLVLVTSETGRSAHAVTRQTSFEAAEAGVDAYTSKLLEDHQYYGHQVATGESTRRSSTGTLVAAGGTWSSSLTWTYPNGHDAWAPLANGYEYNLQISAPDVSGATTVYSVGRPHGDTNTSNWRELQVVVRPSSVADYYRIVNGDVSFGSDATTNGQVYANGNINHDGTASANLFAEGQVTGSTNFTGGATAYDRDSNPTIRSKIPVPIQFSSFLASLVDIQTASNNGGNYFYDNTRDAWVIAFQTNGTFTAKACKASPGRDVADVAPTELHRRDLVPRAGQRGDLLPPDRSSSPATSTDASPSARTPTSTSPGTSTTSPPARTFSGSSPTTTSSSADTYRTTSPGRRR